MLLNLSPELKVLSALLGGGRTQGAVTATLTVMSGVGVYLPIKIDQLTCGIWLAQQEWADWLERVLAVSDMSCLDSDLLVGMSHWALSPLQTVLPQLVLDNATPRPVHLLKQWTIVCTFTVENRQFNCVLLDWPYPILNEVLSGWNQNAAPEPTLHYQCGLVAGWCRLSLAQLQHIGIGDGLRVRAAADIDGGRCWLWQTKGPQIYIVLNGENSMTIQNINQDIDALLELDIAPTEVQEVAPVFLQQLPQTLVMEIGRVAIPLAELSQLTVGQTLNCQSSLYGEVSIRLQGQQIGSGSLVHCEDELLVRIDQWGLHGIPDNQK